jgi:hypothetical protein
MTQRGSCAHGALVILVILAGRSASAQPPRPAAPPTYDCEPGRPDPVTKSCRCPDDYEPHVHESKIPYCRKLPKRTRTPRSQPAAEPSGLACGELAPRTGVACTRACGDVQRDAVPSPWNTGAVSWIPLNGGVPPATRTCSHGPTANAMVDASCAREAGRLSVGITASAGRAGDCGACTESSSVAAFDWRTRVPRRSRAVLFVQARQTKGTAASKRCTLQVGAETRSWGDVEAGIVRSLDDRDLDLHLTCMDPSAGLVSAGCRGIDEPVTLAIDLETGSLPPPSLAATGEYHGPPGFDRGMQTTQHCGNNPESWVRGSATLDTASGRLGVDLQLETDSTAAGPKGKLSVEIRGDGGRVIARVESTEVGIGGKPPGHAVSRTYSASVQLREYVAKRAAQLTIHAACTGSVQRLYGIGGDPTPALALTVR